MTTTAARRAAGALQRVTAELRGAEDRPGQQQMAEAVADAIDRKRHLVVQAGTGTGKTIAYLVPALLSGRRTVVATATKALQDQLATKDLPFLQEHLGEPFDFAVLKGRSNYVCRQRIDELSGAGQLALDGLAERASPAELATLKLWAATSETGDRAELPAEPSPATWAAISVSAQECPGARRCPMGDTCFAEAARRKAGDAEVVVVNLHLLGLDVATDGAILPEHDLVIVDEAHQLEDIVSDTCGFELSAGRFQNLARSVRSILEDPAVVDDLETSGSLLSATLAEHVDRRLRGAPPADLVDALTLIRARLDRVADGLRVIPDDAGDDVGARKSRAVQLNGHLQVDVAAAISVPESMVAWVEGPSGNPRLRVAPIDVTDVLRQGLWDRRPTVLTSATLPDGLADQLGIAAEDHDRIDVGSPFDYEHHGLLYCATHLPDPRQPTFDPAVHDELVALISAAGGRTLSLFTSYRAMDAALEAVRARIDTPVLGQRDLPKPALVEQFSADEATSLFATMGFWQGIDVPGRTLSLVTIDRLPFPRPDEPLLQARRERAKADAFRLIDLPRTSMMLAQGVGRLIRSASDRGVVAVLDPRLAKARSYRWVLLDALPPFRRTKDRAEVEAFLAEITA
ncbi:MAG: ATP-dependent DNA helicase [Actinobacteria bacterium]|nr:ATP-dependent DNA helicase [Actinomycetota bacterium]